MKLATWNVNSLNVRLPQVLDWLAANPVDVLCIQELKLTDDKFPEAAFKEAGYHAVWAGQKTYNGVAIVSRVPGTSMVRNIPNYEDPQQRVLALTFPSADGDVRVVCAYCPNGQSVGSDKYAYKLEWFEAMRAWLADEIKQYPRLAVLGDYNVAPADERLPLLLSLNGGYVDTLGFIALHGLFSAHVTGNFVTIGYVLGNGASGAWTKLAALPVFCLGVFLARLYGQARREAGKPAFMRLLTVKTLLLCVAAALAVRLGPFPMGDSWGLFATGMTLVLAMSIQNAVHRVHLGAAPPSTLMTGTTTQIMLDLADTVRGEADAAAGRRMGRMSRAVLAFAVGCGAAALLHVGIGRWAFALPPLVSLAGQALARAYPG